MQEINITFGINELGEAAAQFLALIDGDTHFTFYGEMGVGKTTFITALCKALGTDDLVSSPSFAIVNEYAAASGDPIYHFDFYRIKTSTELLDIGFYDYCDYPAYCFIEWPEKAEEIIPDDFIAVSITVREDGMRELKLRHK